MSNDARKRINADRRARELAAAEAKYGVRGARHIKHVWAADAARQNERRGMTRAAAVALAHDNYGLDRSLIQNRITVAELYALAFPAEGA